MINNPLKKLHLQPLLEKNSSDSSAMRRASQGSERLRPDPAGSGGSTGPGDVEKCGCHTFGHCMDLLGFALGVRPKENPSRFAKWWITSNGKINTFQQIQVNVGSNIRSRMSWYVMDCSGAGNTKMASKAKWINLKVFKTGIDEHYCFRNNDNNSCCLSLHIMQYPDWDPLYVLIMYGEISTILSNYYPFCWS